MGRKNDGSFFFLVDSLPADAEGYSPPGMIYEDIPPAYIDVFENLEERVIGPVTDQWGTDVSALIPILSDDNHSLAAVMGMDVEAENWNHSVFIHCIGPAMVILLLLTLFFILVSREKILGKLYQSEERFRTLSNAAFEGIIISDKGKILDANYSVVNLFGYTHDELQNLRTIDLAHPDHRDRVKTKVLSEYEKPYEIVALTKDGVNIPLELCGKMYSYNGKKVRVTALRDLTEKKKAENEIKTLKGIIPICSYCKQIRDDKGYWNRIETYISEHSVAEFSHGICPDCANEHFPEMDLESFGVPSKGSSSGSGDDI
jgi:PAS domain S-box-containing protein